jgi:hypothetical protein
MCKDCYKFDLIGIKDTAKKSLSIVKDNIVIYQNALGYNYVSEKCYKVEMGILIEILIYE